MNIFISNIFIHSVVLTKYKKGMYSFRSRTPS